MVDRADRNTYQAVFVLAHRMLQDTPSLLYPDIKGCPSCISRIYSLAETITDGAELKRSARGKRIVELTSGDIFWPNRPSTVLRRFSEELIEGHDNYHYRRGNIKG